jgi:hypothetical protein
MEAQLNASPLATPTMAKPLPSKEDSAERVVAHLPKKGGDVMVLQLGPQCSGQPAWTLNTSGGCSSSNDSNTSSSGTSQSAFQVVTLDTPDQRTTQVLVARWAT